MSDWLQTVITSSTPDNLTTTVVRGKRHLVALPTEVLALIVSHLPNRDVKSLRLTCGFFHVVAKLRLDRVFLSANPRDIEVFNAVADDETFRRGITEIIWDDAVIRYPVTEEIDYEEEMEDPFTETEHGCLIWFFKECKENNDFLKSRYKYDISDRSDRAIAAQLPLRESWAYFRRMWMQQQEVISNGTDAAALRHGLRRFPSLRTVGITPAAHGNTLLFPLYETPTIRPFPPGFNYPLPHGWPMRTSRDPDLVMKPWADEDGGSEEEREKWRGFRIVARALAEQIEVHQVSELILDAHQLDTGLNCRVFEQPCPEYTNLAMLLRQPGFRRLDLSLAVGGQQSRGWLAFRSTFLKRVLSEIGPDLAHLSLTTDVHNDVYVWNFVDPTRGPMSDHIPLLHTVFPIPRWPRLRHFGLSGFLVTKEDLYSLLYALPASLRSLDLGNIYFLAGHWCCLLDDMRDKLGWRDRPVDSRPRVAIHESEINTDWTPGRGVWVDDEVAKFLYGDGANPFVKYDGKFVDGIPLNTGVIRDAFDPGFERPHVGVVDMMNLGYIKKVPLFLS